MWDLRNLGLGSKTPTSNLLEEVGDLLSEKFWGEIYPET
jgi:hypothetical protein